MPTRTHGLHTDEGPGDVLTLGSIVDAVSLRENIYLNLVYDLLKSRRCFSWHLDTTNVEETGWLAQYGIPYVHMKEVSLWQILNGRSGLYNWSSKKESWPIFGPLITSFFFPSLFSYSFCTTIKWETYALPLSLWFLKLTAASYARIRRGRRLHKNVIAISQRPNQKEPRAKRKSTRLQNLSSVQLASHRL